MSADLDKAFEKHIANSKKTEQVALVATKALSDIATSTPTKEGFVIMQNRAVRALAEIALITSEEEKTHVSSKEKTA